MSEITMSDAVRDLMAMDAEVVPARMIAPVLKMSESVLIHRVKSGEWDPDILGKYVISGNRVKFLRKDFLIKCGFMKPEPEGPTMEQLLTEILQCVKVIYRYVQLKVLEGEKNRQCGNTDGDPGTREKGINL